jgi:hypothetical protein
MLNRHRAIEQHSEFRLQITDEIRNGGANRWLKRLSEPHLKRWHTSRIRELQWRRIEKELDVR